MFSSGKCGTGCNYHHYLSFIIVILFATTTSSLHSLIIITLFTTTVLSLKTNPLQSLSSSNHSNHSPESYLLIIPDHPPFFSYLLPTTISYASISFFTQAFPNDADIIKQACWAIASLCKTDATCLQLSSAGAVEVYVILALLIITFLSSLLSSFLSSFLLSLLLLTSLSPRFPLNNFSMYPFLPHIVWTSCLLQPHTFLSSPFLDLFPFLSPSLVSSYH